MSAAPQMKMRAIMARRRRSPSRPRKTNASSQLVAIVSLAVMLAFVLLFKDNLASGLSNLVAAVAGDAPADLDVPPEPPVPAPKP